MKYQRLRKRKKKERKIRKSKLILEEPTTFEEHRKDHGSRSVSTALLREQEEAAQRKSLADKSYLIALNKAERQTSRLIQVDDDESVDAELQTSLERARRLANQQRGSRRIKEDEDEDERKNSMSDRHAKMIATLIRSAQSEAKIKKRTKKKRRRAKRRYHCC